MLSICIPVFNYNVTPLIEELLGQVKNINIPYEIIIIDDGSDEEFKKLNVQATKKTNYIQLDKNIGRAKIRNKFLEISQYEYLLFIDNDSRINSNSYLKNYLELINSSKINIVFGGRIFGKKPSDRKKILRWKYGKFTESKPASIRNLLPNKSFMTNNFLIHRTLYEKVKFNENLVEYGHEDTLFGYELKKLGVEIKHIDNPVLNGDYESNEKYLLKTEKAILNLIYMLKYTNNDSDFIEDVRLLKCYKRVVSLKLAGLLKLFFRLKLPFTHFLLSRGIASLKMFSFYKLGYLMLNIKKR